MIWNLAGADVAAGAIAESDKISTVAGYGTEHEDRFIVHDAFLGDARGANLR
jgi:hypothetical protein